jgi:molecular chaperone Hsp33
MTNDTMQGFMFADMDIRGVHLRLDQGVKTLLNQHQYPAPVASLLTEMLIVACLLSANLKLRGRLSVQIRGAGPLKWVMAECRQLSDDSEQPFKVKGMAQFDDAITPQASLADMVADGRLIITVEPDKGQRYQGVVLLDQATLAECIESYFYQSEQLPTHIQLVSAEEGTGESAAGFMLQRLPQTVSDENQADLDWELVHALASTLTENELAQLPVDQVLHRLFHEQQVKVFTPKPVVQQCDCSRERCGAAIVGLGKMAVDEILEEQKAIIIDCHFCNSHYSFDQVDCHVLLEQDVMAAEANPAVH